MWIFVCIKLNTIFFKIVYCKPNVLQVNYNLKKKWTQINKFSQKTGEMFSWNLMSSVATSEVSCESYSGAIFICYNMDV